MEHIRDAAMYDGKLYAFYASMDDDQDLLQMVVVNDEDRYREEFRISYESSHIKKVFDRTPGLRLDGDIVLPRFIAQHIDSLRKIAAGELIPPLEEIAQHEGH